jgi:hypothetical protein
MDGASASRRQAQSKPAQTKREGRREEKRRPTDGEAEDQRGPRLWCESGKRRGRRASAAVSLGRVADAADSCRISSERGGYSARLSVVKVRDAQSSAVRD